VIAFEGNDEIISANWQVFFTSADEVNCPVVTCDLLEKNCFTSLSPDTNVFLDEQPSKFFDNNVPFAIYAKTDVRKGYS